MSDKESLPTLEAKSDDDPHRWEIEPHPYSRDFDYFITDNDVEARTAILEAAEMYLWDGNEGEERTLRVTMNKDIPEAVNSIGECVERSRRVYAPLTTRSRVSSNAVAQTVGDPAPLCAVHQRLEDAGNLECEIGNDCVACSLNERRELLRAIAPFAAEGNTEDSVTVLRRVVEFYETHVGEGRVIVSYRAPAATTPAPQLHWPFAAKHPNCDECAKEYEAPPTPAPVEQEETKR